MIDPGRLEDTGNDTAAHTHCNSCINLKKCLKSMSKREERQKKPEPPGDQLEQDVSSSSDSPTDYCPIISCPEKCDARFHSCKATEHLMLCQTAKVPCLNKYYGCPFVMERRFIRNHLPHCPASVVVCTVEWSRRPAGEEKITTPILQDSSHLDVAALNGDLETIRKFREDVPARLRRLLQTPMHKCAMMPLGVAGHRIPESIASQSQPQLGSSPESNPRQVQGGFEEFGSWGRGDTADGLRNSPPGLQGSVIHQLQSGPSPPATTRLTLAMSRYNSYIDITPPRLPPPTPPPPPPPVYFVNSQGERKKSLNESPPLEPVGAEPKLSLVLDIIPKHSGRHVSWSTFMCAQELRRDQFPDHFRNVHSEIRTQLDGWLFRRCPMAAYGCPFGAPNLFPRMEEQVKRPDYAIRFNETLHSFCPTQVSTPPVRVGRGDETGLSELPTELLLRLTKYLDPSSLKCLSMTSRRMRDVCGAVISFRGIVVLDWEKETGSEITKDGWVIVGKRWIFPTAFSPIRTWTMSEVPPVSIHLETCQHFATQQNRPKEPFSYQVKEEDL